MNDNSGAIFLVLIANVVKPACSLYYLLWVGRVLRCTDVGGTAANSGAGGLLAPDGVCFARR